MKKLFKKIKLEFFYLRKAFFQYHQGFSYIYYKYVVAPKILRSNQVLEKPVNQPDLSIHILTCHRDLVMTIWSLTSFYLNSGINGALYIHNDGSLTQSDQIVLKKFFPDSNIVDTNNFLADYSQYFSNFEFIKQYREKLDFFLLKKIIDTYFVSDRNLHLIIDSDLLWLNRADQIITEISNRANNSLMMANNSLSYVYFKDGKKLSDDLASYNSGIVLYHKDHFNLIKLNEYLSKIDDGNVGNSHFIEQAAFAYVLNNLQKLPAEKYLIKNDLNDDAVMKHYTSPRRALYYIEGIKSLNLKKYGLSKRD